MTQSKSWQLVPAEQVSKFKGNTSKFYSLITNLTTEPHDNQWTPYKDDVELAEEFVQLFQDKILTIRDSFKDIEPYKVKINQSTQCL